MSAGRLRCDLETAVCWFDHVTLTHLFLDYDPVARAVVDVDQTVIVSVDFVLLRIHGLVS